MAHYPHLFSEITVGRKRLRNRIAFPSTVGNYGQQHAVTDRMIDYYAARAEGGAAMIITEGLIVHESSMPPPNIITLFEERNFDGLQRLAAAVESHGCRLVGQLWHLGRQQLWNSVASPVGVTNQPDAYSSSAGSPARSRSPRKPASVAQPMPWIHAGAGSLRAFTNSASASTSATSP